VGSRGVQRGIGTRVEACAIDTREDLLQSDVVWWFEVVLVVVLVVKDGRACWLWLWLRWLGWGRAVPVVVIGLVMN